MSSTNAKSSTAAIPAKTRRFEFELDVGQESILLPHGFAHPSRVWLIGFRDRPQNLVAVPPETFAAMGRTYRVDRADVPVHLKGVPINYAIEDGEMKFWPVPAHRWKGVVELPTPWVNPPDSA